MASLFDLLGSTYIRRRWPKLFLIMQAVAVTNELTGAHGPGDQAMPDIDPGELWDGLSEASLSKLRRAFEHPAGSSARSCRSCRSSGIRPHPRRVGRHRRGADGDTLNTGRDYSFLFVDGLIRGLVAAIAVVDQTKDPG